MNLPAVRPRFEGYGACPIQALYMNPDQVSDFRLARDLQAVGQREGFEVVLQVWDKASPRIDELAHNPVSGYPWVQDIQFFQAVPDGGVILRSLSDSWHGQVKHLGRMLGVPVQKPEWPLEGGNFFLGKKVDGQPYALVGQNDVLRTAKALFRKSVFSQPGAWAGKLKTVLTYRKAYQAEQARFEQQARTVLADTLGVTDGQLHVISQPDFHLDMAIRPLDGNTVLLNDPALSERLLKKAVRLSFRDPTLRKELVSLYEALEAYGQRQARSYTDTDRLAQELAGAGFEVIRVPAVFGLQRDGKSVVFTNAIVHQRPDGGLVYITNASYLPVLNRLFEGALKTLAPQVQAVEWIRGAEVPLAGSRFKTNTISLKLNRKGGIHCLVSERPDFERWA